MSYLALAKRIHAELNLNATPAAKSEVDFFIDDTVVAVLIDSTVLGSPIWFALRDGWRPDEADGAPIFYASELPALREKSPTELRAIFNVKRTIGGGTVRQ